MSETDIKFCACAIIDLQGFSQHLELGAHDIRTNIGEEAISRLESLTEAINIIEEEKGVHPEFYPEGLYFTRINDALIFNLDLHPDLMPDIGEQVKKGYSVSDIENIFDLNRYQTGEEFEKAVNKRYRKATVGLQKFIGLIARIHLFLNKQENDSYFPGVKSVVSLGQRKPFIMNGNDDPISANFAFSNAYLAEKNLSGPNLFLDNNILKLLSVTNPIKNLGRLAIHKESEHNQIALFDDKDETELEIPEPIKMKLFRKAFIFREVRPRYLAFLQLVEPLKEFSDKEESTAKPIFKNYYDFLTDYSLDYDPKEEGDFSFYRFSLKDRIKVQYEILTSEDSDILKKENSFAMKIGDDIIMEVSKPDISDS